MSATITQTEMTPTKLEAVVREKRPESLPKFLEIKPNLGKQSAKPELDAFIKQTTELEVRETELCYRWEKNGTHYLLRAPRSVEDDTEEAEVENREVEQADTTPTTQTEPTESTDGLFVSLQALLGSNDETLLLSVAKAEHGLIVTVSGFGGDFAPICLQGEASEIDAALPGVLAERGRATTSLEEQVAAIKANDEALVAAKKAEADAKKEKAEAKKKKASQTKDETDSVKKAEAEKPTNLFSEEEK